MKNINYIIFDTETGGLDCKSNPILEIALITIDGKSYKEIDRYETLVKPYDNLIVTKEALNANGIKLRDCETKGISKKELQKNIIQYFKRARTGNHPSQKPVIVGHNITFDEDFMIELLRDNKIGFKELISSIKIDTMADSARAFPKAPNYKLGTCCEMAGIKLINAHRAMPDVIATKDLFVNLSKRLSSDKVTKKDKDSNQENKSRQKFQF